MYKKIAICLLLAIILIPAGAVLAQDYSFGLPKETINVFWNQDGTESIDYLFSFQNEPGAHIIDFVDVGIPNSNFDESSINADVNGKSVTDISRSGYQGSGSGVAVGLGSYAIQPGNAGNLHVFIGKVNRVIYPDSNDQNYVSADFGNTYFGSQNVQGATDLTVIFHLPPGVKPEEPRWHDAPSGFPSTPATALDENGRVTYTWQNPNANGYTQYLFGASFPKQYVPDSAVVRPNPFAWVGSLIGTCGLPALCIGFFALIIGASLYSDRKRKMQYLPPKISIEGHGIKRGLTAIEAAVLMEEPVDKVFTMILFSLIKKNAAQVSSRDPLEIQAIQPAPADLNPYEKDFLAAFEETTPLNRKKDLQTTMINLIKNVSEKMKGFSRKESIAYYKDIMQRAWAQVESAGTPEVKSQKYDENMEWTMLDRDWNNRTRNVFGSGPVFIPVWWGRYDPGFGRGGTFSSQPSSVGGGRPSGGGMSMPTLPGADFAASVVGGVQTFSSKVIGNVTEFTSNITNKTNPAPVVKSSGGGGWGGGGGHSCACACACAGCACACAGGGR